MEPLKDKPSEVYKVGLDLAVEQVTDLLDNKAPGIHFYTLNKYRAAIALYESLSQDFKDVKKLYENSFNPHQPTIG
jgi:methylenetetrahydrofolate reductase (NADPH)